jgi:hypothetical protein
MTRSAPVPLVSVLITSFNRERFLAEAVESVLASTYPAFEVVIVDDSSADGTAGIAERYAAAHEQVRFHRNGRNIGQFPNRNRAAALSRGEYLTYVDSDDVLYPHGLEVLVEALLQHPEAAFAGAGWMTGDRPHPYRVTPREGYVHHFLRPERGRVFDHNLLGTMFRREALFGHGGFIEGRHHSEDTVTLMRLLAHAPMVKTSPVAGWYREHGEQTSEARDLLRDLPVQLWVQLEALLATTCPLTDEEIMVAVRAQLRSARRRVLRMGVRGGKPRFALALMRECREVCRRVGVPNALLRELTLPSGFRRRLGRRSSSFEGPLLRRPLPEGGLAMPTRREMDGTGAPADRRDPHGIEDR